MKGRADGADVESVKGLIKQLSYKAWRRLPAYARVWIDLDDLIQESCAHLYKQRKYYQRSRGAWTTFAYYNVSNHLEGQLSFLATQTRQPVTLRLAASHLPKTHTFVEAIESYERIYDAASVELRSLLAAWIGVPEGRRAPHSVRQRFAFRERDLWRLRYELEAIVEYFKLSFRPYHVEALWASNRLQI